MEREEVFAAFSNASSYTSSSSSACYIFLPLASCREKVRHPQYQLHHIDNQGHFWSISDSHLRICFHLIAFHLQQLLPCTCHCCCCYCCCRYCYCCCCRCTCCSCSCRCMAIEEQSEGIFGRRRLIQGTSEA